MIKVLSTNITSPLGMDTAENLTAVREGRSGLLRHNRPWGLPFDVCASLFSSEQEYAIIGTCNAERGEFTRFEAMVLHSVRGALSCTNIDTSNPRLLFILSTTKGNVELLGSCTSVCKEVLPGDTATKIARTLGITTTPIVVSNACISGVAAQLLALDMLDSGVYDYAVVVGADCQGPFIVSGFNCLKALSDEPCRPFDMERTGLNLGEAAATIIFVSDRVASGTGEWVLKRGSICNDSYHITNPSPRGEGYFKALSQVLTGIEANNMAVLGAHGTATMYNDQMESVAIERAGLSQVPVSALKGYFGHTMGAAGLLETIVTMEALSNGWIPATLGFEERGVSGKVSVCKKHTPTDKHSFVKMMSGFGGCNGALLYDMPGDGARRAEKEKQTQSSLPLVCKHNVRITSNDVTVDGIAMHTDHVGVEMITELYRAVPVDYPRFYRMDLLSRLAFVAVELLLSETESVDRTKCDILIFNRSSSIISDLKHQETIAQGENFFPSPSTFVYTLPNIMVGEVAIRHGISGRTSLCILPERNERVIQEVITANMRSSVASNTMIAGWIDCLNEKEFIADISIYQIIKKQQWKH